jgi:hypothetical protein
MTTKREYDGPLPLDLKAIKPPERQAIFNKLHSLFPNNNEIAIRSTFYGDPDRSAYVIFPEGILESPPTNEIEGGFAALGREFVTRFQSRSKNGVGTHAYYSAVDPKDFMPVYNSPFPSPPSDLFYIGLVDSDLIGEDGNSLKALKQKATSLFYIAARTDEAVHHVAYLSLLDQDHCPKNFQEVENYLDSLVDKCEPLSSLL